MKLDVLFYGRLAELAGRTLTVDAPDAGCTVRELRGLVAGQCASLDEAIRSPASRAFVAEQMVGEAHRLGAGDTVEFLPPVSGG